MDEAPPEAIASAAAQLLRRADVGDVLPTPLDQLDSVAEVRGVIDLAPEPELPPRLRSIVSRLVRKVVGAHALRERTIYIDQSQPLARQRFTHGHELGHKVLPWQHEAYTADDRGHLAHDVEAAFEREANQFAAELLFQTSRFTRQADDDPVSLAVPIGLAEAYGVSLHAAIRRYAHQTEHPCALAVMGKIPRGPVGARSVKVLYTVTSGPFAARYGQLGDLVPEWLPSSDWPLASDAIDLLAHRRSGLLAGTCVLPDTRRGPEKLDYELFFNQRQVFALLRRHRRLRITRTPHVEYRAS